MKILLAALVFTLILSCVTRKKDYAVVEQVPQGHEMMQTEVVAS